MLQTSCYMMLTLATERALMIIEIPPPPPPPPPCRTMYTTQKIEFGENSWGKNVQGTFSKHHRYHT